MGEGSCLYTHCVETRLLLVEMLAFHAILKLGQPRPQPGFLGYIESAEQSRTAEHF